MSQSSCYLPGHPQLHVPCCIDIHIHQLHQKQQFWPVYFRITEDSKMIVQARHALAITSVGTPATFCLSYVSQSYSRSFLNWLLYQSQNIHDGPALYCLTNLESSTLQISQQSSSLALAQTSCAKDVSLDRTESTILSTAWLQYHLTHPWSCLAQLSRVTQFHIHNRQEETVRVCPHRL